MAKRRGQDREGDVYGVDAVGFGAVAHAGAARRGDGGDEGLRPALGALRAVESDLRGERIASAWVDLDIAEPRLAQQGGPFGGSSPAVEKARRAVERARDLLGRAELSQATSCIATAVMALVG